MRMFHRQGKTVEMCSLGCEHIIGIYEEEEWTPTGETYSHDTGYGVEEGTIFLDDSGASCRSVPTVDYPSYMRDRDHTFWYTRPRPAFDETLGRTVSGEVIWRRK
jgi:hypothetical protein